jgi:hypothetical protein
MNSGLGVWYVGSITTREDRKREILTEIPISDVVLAGYLSFCLRDDAREFPRRALRGFLVARCIPGPFQIGPRHVHAAMGAEIGSGALGDGEHDAARHIFE